MSFNVQAIAPYYWLSLLLLEGFWGGGLGPCKGPKSLGTLGKEKREKKGERRILLSVQNTLLGSQFQSDVFIRCHQAVKEKKY